MKNGYKKPIPKWLTIIFTVLAVFFLLGATTGQADMLIIGILFTALAILGFRDNKKSSTVEPVPTAVASVPTTQPDQPVKRKGWHKTWWGILLIIFVIFPIGLTTFLSVLAIGNGSGTYEQGNTPDNNAEQKKKEAEEQEKREQEVAAKYQMTIDTYAPIYCKNHQDITVNEPTLHEDGWPMANNQAGINEDDCKILLGLLYNQRVNDPRVTEYIKSISERKVAVGMTKVEVVYTWGSPNDINKTTSSGGTWEQWVFGSPIYGGNYVYFDNNIVTSVQSH